MRPSLPSVLLTGCAAAVVLTTVAAVAGTTTDGKASSGGFYWQKVDNSGKVQYLCRSNKEPGIQKNARCQGAKAVKP
ncbi:MAG: hypothetical protein K9J72_11730 [Synechococcus sp. Tobar2m-G35]|nr:hypothetical protein [Synechococcus sp. Tobar2m-G35]